MLASFGAAAAARLATKAELEKAFDKAWQIIKRHRLLTGHQMACSFLMDAGSTSRVAHMDVREKHNAKCGGAPEVAPRRFSLEIDLRTGATKWDYWDYQGDYDGGMRAIPGRHRPSGAKCEGLSPSACRKPH